MRSSKPNLTREDFNRSRSLLDVQHNTDPPEEPLAAIHLGGLAGAPEGTTRESNDDTADIQMCQFLQDWFKPVEPPAQAGGSAPASKRRRRNPVPRRPPEGAQDPPPRPSASLRWELRTLGPNGEVSPFVDERLKPLATSLSVAKPFFADEGGQLFWFKTWMIPTITVRSPLLPATVTLRAATITGDPPIAEEVPLSGDTSCRTVDGEVTFRGLMFQKTSFNCNGARFHLLISCPGDACLVSDGIFVHSKNRAEVHQPKRLRPPRSVAAPDPKGQGGDGPPLSPGVKHLLAPNGLPPWLKRAACTRGSRILGITLSRCGIDQIAAIAADGTHGELSHLRIVWCSENVDAKVGAECAAVLSREQRPLVSGAAGFLHARHAGALHKAVAAIHAALEPLPPEAVHLAAEDDNVMLEDGAPFYPRVAVDLGILGPVDGLPGALSRLKLHAVLYYSPQEARLTLISRVENADLFPARTASDDDFKDICETSNDVIDTTDRQGFNVYTNQTAATVLAMEPWESIGAPIGGLLHPKDKEAIRESLQVPEGKNIAPTHNELGSVLPDDAIATTHRTETLGLVTVSRIRGVARYLAGDGYRWMDFVCTFKWLADDKPLCTSTFSRVSKIHHRILWKRDGRPQSWVGDEELEDEHLVTADSDAPARDGTEVQAPPMLPSGA